MVKPFDCIGAIPVIMAVLIAIPLLTQPEIPFLLQILDKIEIEYTKHQLKKILHGVTEKVVQKNRNFMIKENGDLRYTYWKWYPNQMFNK